MCDTCPAHIPGPGEVGASLLSLLAKSKAVRRVVFGVVVWGICVPMLPSAMWDLFGWWCIAIGAVLAAGFVAVVVGLRKVSRSRHVLIEVPASLRAALPAPRPVRAALPRNLSIGRGRRALPAPAKALPSAEPITGRVVTVPMQRAARP